MLTAQTAAAAPCGTAIIPNGIGLGAPASPTALLPLTGQANNTQPGLLLYRPLVWPGPQATADPVRSLAQHIEALDNNTRFRVTLKPWRWSDGAPITADDVLFGWREILALGTDFQFYGQGGIPGRVTSVRQAGPMQVDFVLAQPTNPDWFELNGLSNIYPLPHHTWGDLSRDEIWRRQTDPSLVQVVDGPFRLTDFRLDRYAAYAPNPLYGGPPVHVARLVVTFLEGENPLHAVQAGDADLAGVPLTLWNRLQKRPDTHAMTLPEPWGYWPLELNFRNPDVAFFRDATVRRALAQAVNQPDIIRLVFHGLAHENHVPVPVAATAWRSPASLAGDPDLAFNPNHATALLRAAGWRLGADHVLQKDGHSLAFTVLDGAGSDDAPEIQALLLVQRDLRAIGVDMRLHRMGFDELLATVADPVAWDAALLPETASPVPDGSGFLDTGGGQNMGGYSDPTMDGLVGQTTNTPGAAALFAYQDYAAAQEPWIILPQGQLPVLVANRLHGVEQFSNPLGFWEPEDLWVEDGECHAPGAATLR